MTDGENTNQYDVRQPYKSGFSPIFYHATDDRYSVHVASRDDSEDYWISIGEPNEFNGYWSDEPYSNGGEESVALGWPYLWASYTGRYIADRYLQVPANQSGDWDLYNRIRSNGDELYAGRTQATTTCGPSATPPMHRTSSSSPSASRRPRAARP
jgi:hypothetical protein